MVPQVAQVFTSTQRSLPGLTVAMLTLSHGVQRFGTGALLAVLIGVMVLQLARRHPPFRQRMDAA